MAYDEYWDDRSPCDCSGAHARRWCAGHCGIPGAEGPACPVRPCCLPAAGSLSGDNQTIQLPAGNIERQVPLPRMVFPAQHMEYGENLIRILRAGYYNVSYFVQGRTDPPAVWYAYGKLNGIFTPLLDDRNYTPVIGNVTLRGASVMYLREGDTLSLYVNADTATTLFIREIGGAQLLVTRIPLCNG